MRRCWGLNRNLIRCGRFVEKGLFCDDHRRQPFAWGAFVVFTVIAGSIQIYSFFGDNQKHVPAIDRQSKYDISRTRNHDLFTKDNTAKYNSAKGSGTIHTSETTSRKEKDSVSHIQPLLVTILDRHPLHKGFLLFTIKNEGLLEAKSVKVDHLSMRYMKKENKTKIVQGGSDNSLKYDDPGRNWLFVSELKPNMAVSKLTGETVFPDNNTHIDMLYFHIEYLYQDSKYKDRESIYFAEDNKIYSYNEYKNNNDFASVNVEIKRALREIVPRFKSLGSHRRQ